MWPIFVYLDLYFYYWFRNCYSTFVVVGSIIENKISFDFDDDVLEFSSLVSALVLFDFDGTLLVLIYLLIFCPIRINKTNYFYLNWNADPTFVSHHYYCYNHCSIKIIFDCNMETMTMTMICVKLLTVGEINNNDNYNKTFFGNRELLNHREWIDGWNQIDIIVVGKYCCTILKNVSDNQ